MTCYTDQEPEPDGAGWRAKETHSITAVRHICRDTCRSLGFRPSSLQCAVHAMQPLVNVQPR